MVERTTCCRYIPGAAIQSESHRIIYVVAAKNENDAKTMRKVT